MSKQSSTLYLTSLAAAGSAAAALLALTYFKPTNLGQNDLHYNWKKLSLFSGIGSILTLHYGVTGNDVVTSSYKFLTNLVTKK